MPSPQLAQAIEAQRKLAQEMGTAQTPQEFREIYSRFMGQFPIPKDVKIESVDANGVPGLRITPPEAAPGRTILYLHGGGYMIGSAADYREMCAGLAKAAKSEVVVIDYRLAPEHACPAPVDDAVTAYQWLLDNGVSPDRIVLAGDSAGGGLTIAALVAIRDRGLPRPAAGVGISPWVDLEGVGESMTLNAANDPLVSIEMVGGMAQAYLQGQDVCTPLAAPLHADLQDLPPLLIQAGSHETLLDDAVRLADKAKAAGVDVTFESWDQMLHVWHMLGSFLPEARQAIDRIGEYVQERTS